METTTQETLTNETETIITFKQEEITVSLKHANGEPYTEQEQAHVAYQDGIASGLAYRTRCTDDGDVFYTVTHLPTGLEIGGETWTRRTYTEVDAMKWIEKLLAIANWTEKEPVITAKSMTLLGWAALGVWSSIEED